MSSPACCPPNSTGYLATDDSAARAGTCIALADGTELYLVAPPAAAAAAADAGASAARGVVLVPDIFGWNGGRTRALADHLAATRGLWVAVPKILQVRTLFFRLALLSHSFFADANRPLYVFSSPRSLAEPTATACPPTLRGHSLTPTCATSRGRTCCVRVCSPPRAH